MTKIKHIAIAGNIGAGKTTMSTALAKRFGWDVHYEDTENNPYLSDFYNDMNRWSFNLQIYFLNSRYQQVIKILNGDRVVVQDRTIYEDANIFAPNLHDMGLMSSRDFENYYTLFKVMSSQVNPPDLLIYLKADIPKLLSNISNRGRDYESNISVDYLKRLNERYENWIGNYQDGNLLIVDVDHKDFINKQDDMEAIVALVKEKLNI